MSFLSVTLLPLGDNGGPTFVTDTAWYQTYIAPVAMIAITAAMPEPVQLMLVFVFAVALPFTHITDNVGKLAHQPKRCSQAVCLHLYTLAEPWSMLF